MYSFYNNQKGQGIFTLALIMIALAGAGVTVLLNKGDLMVFIAKEEKKELIARQDFDRLFALGSYLVSNNFILCRREAWNGLDIDEMQCLYQGERPESVNGDTQNIGPENFALTEIPRAAPDEPLSFEVDIEKFRKGLTVETQNATSKGIVKFELVDTYKDELYEQLAGKLTDDERKVNMDHYMVLQTVTLTLNATGNREDYKQVTRKIGIRRPIAIPQMRISGSKCSAECKPAISEGQNVSCRGAQTIDPRSTSVIDVKVVNKGPGVIYDLVYKKDVRYTNGRPSEYGGTFNAIGNDNFMFPDIPMTASDSVNCLKFVQSTNNPSDNGKRSLHSVVAGRVFYNIAIEDVAGNRGQGEYIDVEEVYVNPMKYLLDGLLPPAYAMNGRLKRARARSNSTSTSTSTSTSSSTSSVKSSSNSNSAIMQDEVAVEDGQVSMLEPFRGVVSESSGVFQGYTESVYVEPSH